MRGKYQLFILQITRILQIELYNVKLATEAQIYTELYSTRLLGNSGKLCEGNVSAIFLPQIMRILQIELYDVNLATEARIYTELYSTRLLGNSGKPCEGKVLAIFSRRLRGCSRLSCMMLN
ncbi:hypothetical protein DRW42_19380 [Pedobacter miscanthi]|uniref:Uncharacterized protein n=1 Tax=Pedobacter miscanthi TaxID=2259170 RepID=A0A366KRT6_9SPHI|nr:hypothetical protein DRW42_19380 [Pedobacter miscanthi]